MIFDIIKKYIIHKQIKRLIIKQEKQFDDAKYLFIPKKSDTLLVVFSGFTGEKRKYNYVSSFHHMNVNQLYILDVWGGYLGSYYWMHYGSNHPEETVSKLIQYIMEENNLTTLITCGSSKGGTAAIYFGLKHNAKKIYSGASQFLVGSYLDREEHREILLGMIGTCEKDKKVEELNSKISKEIEKHLESTAINLFYSTRELTYERQILPLKKYLDAKKVKYKETIVDFEDHASVGSYFPHFVLHELKDFI